MPLLDALVLGSLGPLAAGLLLDVAGPTRTVLVAAILLAVLTGTALASRGLRQRADGREKRVPPRQRQHR